MRSFLPIPPLHLSVTARGLIGSSEAQCLTVSRSAVVQASVGAHWPHASAHFTASTPSFALVRSSVSVCAPLLALGRACVSRCLPFSRLGRCARSAPFSVGSQPSRIGGRSIIPSFPVCANPAVERDAGQAAALRSHRLARRPSLPRYAP